MLLTEDWASFIRDRGVRVEIGIDGPERFHDRYRVTRRGLGTHQRTLAGIRNLQAASIDFHVITVLTAEALESADEFFDFYVEHGIGAWASTSRRSKARIPDRRSSHPGRGGPMPASCIGSSNASPTARPEP